MNLRMLPYASVVALLFAASSAGQSIKKQVRDSEAPKTMTTGELAELADPLFTLVLKPKPNEFRFDEVVRLLKGAT